MECAELQRLLEELDLAERQLSASEQTRMSSARAQQLAQEITLHREQHACCDFKPVAN